MAIKAVIESNKMKKMTVTVAQTIQLRQYEPFKCELTSEFSYPEEASASLQKKIYWREFTRLMGLIEESIDRAIEDVGDEDEGE